MSATIPVNLIRGRKPRTDVLQHQQKPSWLRVQAPGNPQYLHLKHLMHELDLNTVCEEASCPNIGECWKNGTATFMILGSICTRACSYCNVTTGKPNPIDTNEPVRLASAVERLGLSHVVITSVDRDDLPDGGASVFADTIVEVRRRIPNCRIEVLIPDFRGRKTDLLTVLNAQPDVLNHNIETVARLYRMARPGGRYKRALELLDRVHHYAPDIPTKSGLMVGLGENLSEILTTLHDLRGVGCDLLTIGQYLRPSIAHLNIARYYSPEEFSTLRSAALELGFGHVESGPLVRSSYHAHKQTESFNKTQH